MKNLLSFTIGLLLALPAIGQGSLTVTVQNVRVSQGNIQVGLFSDEDTFLKKAIFGKVVKASAGEVVVLFENLRPGNYGLSVIHDENGNSELDSNAIGMPTEGFAFGNNAMGMFGPPSFDKTLVTIDSSSASKQTIRLKYL